MSLTRLPLLVLLALGIGRHARGRGPYFRKDSSGGLLGPPFSPEGGAPVLAHWSSEMSHYDCYFEQTQMM